MRKSRLLIIIAVLFSSVAYSQTTSEKLKAIEDEMVIMKAQAKLDSLKRVLSRIPIDLPCAAELDKDPNYIRGLGIGEPQINPRSEAEARKLAVSEAKLEISNKWIGTIDSVVEEYYKRTNHQHDDWEELEETLRISGEKAINQFVREVCSELVEKKEEKRTSIVYYYVASVPVSSVVATIAKDCEKKGYDIDKGKMQESIVSVLNPETSK